MLFAWFLARAFTPPGLQALVIIGAGAGVMAGTGTRAMLRLERLGDPSTSMPPASEILRFWIIRFVEEKLLTRSEIQ